MNPIRPDWLAQTTEPPIDPDRPICDAHHHLWDRPDNRYLIPDFLADCGGHNIVSSVFVECMANYREDVPESLQPVGETEFIETIADRHQRENHSAMNCCAAIISYADLRLGRDVIPVLDAHRAASPKRFRGIRHAVGWGSHPDVPISHTKPTESLLLDRSFREGIACLQDRQLIYECYLYHTQLQELADLARAFPKLTIILNHFGGPLGVGPYKADSDEVLAPWKTGIADLADCPNVYAKLGGIAMPRNGFGWHDRPSPPTSQQLAKTYAHYYHYTIDQFGPSRCMFESNFPIEKISCSYTILWNAFKRIATPYTDAEQSDLFHNTAHKIYKFDKARASTT